MACDRCWRLKVRCVFDPATDEDCALCSKQVAECIWTRTKKPTPAPDEHYVFYLEGRAKEIEERLKQLKVLPGINLKREIDNLLEIRHEAEDTRCLNAPNDATTSQTSVSRSRESTTLLTQHSLGHISTPVASRMLQAIRLTNVTLAPATACEDYEENALWKQSPIGPEPQYYGPSSIEALVLQAELCLDQAIGKKEHLRYELSCPQGVESYAYASDEIATPSLQAEFPPADLTSILVARYFERVHPVIPVLHQPLFESQLRNNLHAQDDGFARLLLIVCAIGARWCGDPRVLDEQSPSELSAGFRWFRAAYRNGINFMYMPSLANAQFVVLSLYFFLGSSTYDMAWLFAAKVSRIFDALGAHRRKKSVTLADELLKRSFRCFLIMDQITSATVGRPSVFQNLEIDVDDVLEVDDLYWSPELNASPPPVSQGSSLQLVVLNYSSRLCTITGQAIQIATLPGSTKVRIGLDTPQGEEWVARNLNQQLNKWVASVPINLRLPDPERFAEHSISHLHLVLTLWTCYCYTTIYINRSFINSKVPEIATASFHNCYQAARQCAESVDAYYKVPDVLPLESAIPGVFSSAMILIIDSIANSSPEQLEAGGTVLHNPEHNATRNERDIETCLEVLERMERCWKIAGKLRDVVKEFREVWSSHISPPLTTVSEPTQPPEEWCTHKSYATAPFAVERLQPTGLYAHQVTRTPMLADGLNPAPVFPNAFVNEMGEPNLLTAQMQSARTYDGPQSAAYAAQFLPEEAAINFGDVMVPDSANYDLFSLLPGSEHDWNDTMGSVLRLWDSEPGP
ncbi:Fungal specific transcription factor domain [Rhizoctonia solani]|uniref:Fungal specific transcription factor domain n=1 Tax=Rhizoctonia solani TaxID=456999 RepID=A0A8H8P5R4_9AGAM|nr:Fungal specific transcription factor domain [Rhizoctonia solani]QRW24817.1 Fungal specific transcription factor domain [Rhizoctonia solani]